MEAIVEFEQLLRTMVAFGASDLHLSVGVPPVLRIDGGLRRLGEEELTAGKTESYAQTILTDSQLQHFAEYGEVDFSYGIEGLSRFRFHVYRRKNEVSFAIRAIPNEIPHLSDLNLPPILEILAQKPQGLILVTGPTGSGKSTTLASMLDYINRTQKKHIVTLEDPIEFMHTHQKSVVDQREVGRDTRSFASGLRAALRQDPDVILVGEMRDLETISTAITAAETGHLVFATLHTSDAPQAIDRIIDAFPAHQQAQVRVQLGSSLAAVIAQRLLRRKEGRGRVCAAEILINTPAVANLIRSEKVHQIRSVMQTSRAMGMQTMESAIQDLMQRGVVDYEEAKSYLSDPLGTI